MQPVPTTWCAGFTTREQFLSNYDANKDNLKDVLKAVESAGQTSLILLTANGIPKQMVAILGVGYRALVMRRASVHILFLQPVAGQLRSTIG